MAAPTLSPAQLGNLAIIASVAKAAGVNPYTPIADAYAAESSLMNSPPYWDTNGPSVGLFSLHSTSSVLGKPAVGGELANVPGKNLAAQEIAAQNPLINALTAIKNFATAQRTLGPSASPGLVAFTAEGAAAGPGGAWEQTYIAKVNAAYAQFQASPQISSLVTAAEALPPSQAATAVSRGTLGGARTTIVVPSSTSTGTNPGDTTSPTTLAAQGGSVAQTSFYVNALGPPSGVTHGGLLGALELFNAWLNPPIQKGGAASVPIVGGILGIFTGQTEANVIALLQVVFVRGMIVLIGLLVVVGGLLVLTRGGPASLVLSTVKGAVAA